MGISAMTPLVPDLSLDRALRELRQRLGELLELTGRGYEQAKTEEEEWMHFTENIIEGTFGNPSTNLTKFHNVRQAGLHSSDVNIRFECRIEEYAALLRGLIRTVELQLPDETTQGVYPPGDEYKFYRDLSTLVREAKNSIIIVDPYLSEDVFNLYVDKVPDTRGVLILSNTLSSNVMTVAEKYARSRPLELRSSNSIHDRVVFIDSRAWVIGQSIKDAAH